MDNKPKAFEKKKASPIVSRIDFTFLVIKSYPNESESLHGTVGKDHKHASFSLSTMTWFLTRAFRRTHTLYSGNGTKQNTKP